MVKRATERGEKTLVWTNFIRNIRLLQSDLAEFHPATIHGGIPSKDMASAETEITRESELDRFRTDPQCTVLLANPAAAGGGHKSSPLRCHHAIYLDRTFNAGHFLQSQDRIHRLGLDQAIVTEVYFVNFGWDRRSDRGRSSKNKGPSTVFAHERSGAS